METVNTFTKGLVSDKHPLTIGQDTMTDALNATLITYNGNEMILQNDMGNSRLAVPKSTKQVRLTIYQKTDDVTSKGYNTDVNDVKDRLSDADISLRSAFKPIGVVEHGGILYIASQRDVYNDKGEKEGTEFEIGSFPGPKIEEPDTIKQERNYDDVEAWNEVKGNNKVHILYDQDPRNIIQGELLTDHQEIFRPGTPIEIFPQQSEPNSLSTPEKRHWYKLRILNLSDNNRDITEELMSCITWDQEDKTSWGDDHLNENPKYFYPNIKNAKLGFSIELEDIDAFLLDRVVGDTVEEKEYNNQRLPFLIEPIFPDSLKSKYAPNYSLDKDSYYLSINLFEIVQESDVKVNQYRVRYRLTNRNGSSINVNNNKQVEVDNNDWIVTNSLNLEEVSNSKFRSTSSGVNYSTIIPIGENKNVNIELEIYPESEDFKFNDGFYPFSNHVIRLNLNLWESPGMWGSTSYLTNESDYFDSVEIDKKVWYDMDEEQEEDPKFKFDIPYNSKYDITDYFFGCSGHKALWRTNQNFDGSYYINNQQYQEEKVNGEDTICSIDKLEYAGRGTEVFDGNIYGTYDARIINNNSSSTHPSVFSSFISARKRNGTLYNLKYFGSSYDIKLEDTLYGNAQYSINNLITVLSGNQMITYKQRGILLEKCEIGIAIQIGTKVFPAFNQIKKSNKPLCMWGYDDHTYAAPRTNHGFNGLLNSDDSKLAGDWAPKTNGYEEFSLNKTESFISNNFNETPVYIGAYFPVYFGISYMENGGSKIPYHYGGIDEFPSSMQFEISPHIGGDKISSASSREGLYSLFIESTSQKAISYLKNKQDSIIKPVINQVTEKDGVQYRISTQNLEHIQNTNQLQINSVDSLKNTNLYQRQLDLYINNSETKNPTSFPITTEPYNYLIFDNIEIPWYSAAEGLYQSSYYMLQFYFKKNTLNGKLQIAIESNNQSAIVEEKGYCQGISLNQCNFNSHNGLEITNDSTAYYTYVQIPICGTDINIFFKAIGQVEVRNIGIQKKVQKNSYYEPKGAVLTLKEDVLLYKKEEEVAPNIYRVVTEIRSKGTYLPCFSASDNSQYYEILTTKNNGTFSLPKQQDSEILIGDGKVTIDNNTYTIIL